MNDPLEEYQKNLIAGRRGELPESTLGDKQDEMMALMEVLIICRELEGPDRDARIFNYLNFTPKRPDEKRRVGLVKRLKDLPVQEVSMLANKIQQKVGF